MSSRRAAFLPPEEPGPGPRDVPARCAWAGEQMPLKSHQGHASKPSNSTPFIPELGENHRFNGVMRDHVGRRDFIDHQTK
jgi:hypothetical protein